MATAVRIAPTHGSPAFAVSSEDPPDRGASSSWGDTENDNNVEMARIIETQRIERAVSLPAQQEKHNTPGVPFVPPDPDLAAEQMDPQLQVIELDAEEEENSEVASEQVKRVKRVDPTADLTLRDLIFFVFDGFPSNMYRKRTANWIRLSDIVNNLLLLVVLLSCFSFSTESLPVYYDRDLESFNIIEDICISIFTFDLLIRVILTRENIKFFKSIQNWVDFISIVPFYVAQFVGTSSGGAALIMLRLLRLMRVFRIFKLTKRSVGLQAVIEAMLQSSEAISLLSFLLMIATVLFSSAMFFAEQTGANFDTTRQLWIRDDGSISPFQSIFHTMWWCVVTMTTVGYGDDVPVTALGKVVGSITMLCGVFVLAFPTVILSTNFQEVHEAKVEKNKRLAKELLDLEREMEEDQIEEDDAQAATLAKLAAGGADAEEKAAPEIDPRFAALIEKLQDNYSKFTRFPYKFNPYAERKLRTTARRRKSEDRSSPTPVWSPGAGTNLTDSSPRVPVVSFRQGRGGDGADAEPGSDTMEIDLSRAHRERSQPHIKVDDEEMALIADVERIAEGTVQIVDNEVAVFTPALYFEPTDSNHLYARVETVPGSEQELLTLHLVIDASLCKPQVDKAIAKHRPDDFFISIPRSLKKLILRLETENALLRDIRLITTQFDLPVGTVPISLLVPSHHVLSILLHNLSAVKFLAKCYYDEPVIVKEPLARYGGVLLTGDAFDDETELQLFVTEEDARLKQSKSELHGEEQTTAFGRRGSNYILGSSMPAAAASATVAATASPPFASPDSSPRAAAWAAREGAATHQTIVKRGATPIPPQGRGATPVPPHRGSTPLPVDGRSSGESADVPHAQRSGGAELSVPILTYGRGSTSVSDDSDGGDGFDIPFPPTLIVEPSAQAAHFDLGEEFSRNEQSASAEPSLDEEPYEQATAAANSRPQAL